VTVQPSPPCAVPVDVGDDNTNDNCYPVQKTGGLAGVDHCRNCLLRPAEALDGAGGGVGEINFPGIAVFGDEIDFVACNGIFGRLPILAAEGETSAVSTPDNPFFGPVIENNTFHISSVMLQCRLRRVIGVGVSYCFNYQNGISFSGGAPASGGGVPCDLELESLGERSCIFSPIISVV